MNQLLSLQFPFCRDLTDELSPVIKEVIDRKQVARRKKKSDTLRLALARILHYMAQNGVFAAYRSVLEWKQFICQYICLLAGVPGVTRVNKKIMMHLVYPFSFRVETVYLSIYMSIWKASICSLVTCQNLVRYGNLLIKFVLNILAIISYFKVHFCFHGFCNCSIIIVTLRGDKVSMLIHACSHKALRKIK